jgi:hypothetical protein
MACLHVNTLVLALCAQTKYRPLITQAERTPYVLRPAGGDNIKYKFLGECYLHGIMYGEALKEGYNVKKLTLI